MSLHPRSGWNSKLYVLKALVSIVLRLSYFWPPQFVFDDFLPIGYHNAIVLHILVLTLRSA
jgi:hypothetical protein